MFQKLVKFISSFNIKPVAEPKVEAPYKLEPPEPVTSPVVAETVTLSVVAETIEPVVTTAAETIKFPIPKATSKITKVKKAVATETTKSKKAEKVAVPAMKVVKTKAPKKTKPDLE